MTNILVTGATGNVGAPLVSALCAEGHHVRALIHNADHPRADHTTGFDGSSAQLVRAEFADPSSVRTALDGIDAVFLSCGNVPAQVAYECAVIDEAKKAGVRRIVKLSARGAAIGSRVAYWDWHGLIERHLRASGLPSVLLQPSFLMTNLLAAADQVRYQGMIFAPAADAQIAMIDPVDVASVAALALTDEGHDGKTYVLTGPEAITYQQVAEALSAATGRAVGFIDIPAEAASAALIDAGVPAFAADQVITVFGELRARAQVETTGTVGALTGRPARSFLAFAGDHVGAFRGADLRSSLPA